MRLASSSSKTEQGIVGQYNDWYAVTILGTQTLDLDLGTSAGAAFLTLYDQNGTALQTVATGTGDAWLSRTLTSGRYTIAVSAQVDTAIYALTAAIGVPGVGTSASAAAGTSLATARTLNSGAAIAEWVGPGDAVDWYAFAPSSASVVVLTLAGLSANATLTLRDATGNALVSAPGTPTAPASIRLPVMAGGYTLTVESSSATGYSLSYGAVADPDTVGNDAPTAKALGTLSTTPITVSERVDRADPTDRYSFAVSALSHVNVVLAGLSYAATLTVYGADGSVIATTTGAADHQAALLVDLAPLTSGSYSIDVTSTGVAAGTGYTLTASDTVYTDFAGNTAALATYVTGLSGVAKTFTDSILSLDPYDWYSFVLGAVTTVDITLSGLTTVAPSPVRFTLYGPNGATIATDNATADGSAIDAVQLGSGAYTLLVDKPVAGGSGVYALSLATGSPTVGSSLTDAAGNTAATGRDLGPLTSRTLFYADWIGGADTDDYYRFVLGSAALARFDLTGLTAGATLTLRNSAGAVVASAVGNVTGVVSHGASLWEALPGGSYTLDVSGGATGTGYNLSTSALAISDGAGSGPGAARKLGVLNIGGQVFTDTLGAFDTTDSYQFSLSVASTVNLLATGLTTPALLSLADASNTVITSDYGDNGTDATASVIETLAPGTYTATLGVAGPPTTTYTISLSATPAPTSAGISPGAATSFGTLGSRPVAGDFNGDGSSDIIERNAFNGAETMLVLNGPTVIGAYVVGGDPTFTIAGSGDLDGDGHNDLIWTGPGGLTFAWLMNGQAVTGAAYIGGDTTWSIAGTGDFDGDGKTDLLWHSTTGVTAMWFMDGTNIRSAVTISTDPAWSVVGTGDFDGDGKTDLLWRNASSGVVVDELMNGAAVTGAAVLSVDPNWRPIFTGDFDGDGRDDILWRNSSTGAVALWEMNGLGPKASAIIGGDTNWSVAAVGDFNSDGKADVVWRCPAGYQVLNEMNGPTTILSQTLLNDAGTTPSL